MMPNANQHETKLFKVEFLFNGPAGDLSVIEFELKHLSH